MALTVNSNIASLNAQRNLSSSSNNLSTSLERLSSGSRINSAKDDAAGLQIANRLTSQINGLGVAVKNANDGISIAQTAEGAMQESTNILQRMRDLALQSANGSNSAVDRDSLQKEVSSLQSELTRISDTTSFGNQKLLNGSFGSKDFQVGANANETIGVSLSSTAASKIGESYRSANVTGLTGFASARLVPADGSASLKFDDNKTLAVGADGKNLANIKLEDGMSAKELAAGFNSIEGISGVSAKSDVSIGTFGAAGTAADTFTVEIDNISVSFAGAATNDAVVANFKAALDAKSDELKSAGISYDSAVTTSVDLSKAGGENIDIKVSLDSAVAGATYKVGEATTTSAALGLATNSYEVTGSLDFANAKVSSDIGTLTIGGAASSGVGTSNVVAGTVVLSAAKFDSVAKIDIGTAEGAQNALSVIDGALANIDSQRADLGAVQSRFDSTISNLQNIGENASAARSRIVDTDYAVESANLAKNQIMQQAGTAMLAQANQLPQAVLSLLG
ncbi:MAG: flagellin [Pseudomonadales bacterium]|nr:flagellin [Pseudomonadales bacterium]